MHFLSNEALVSLLEFSAAALIEANLEVLMNSKLVSNAIMGGLYLDQPNGMV